MSQPVNPAAGTLRPAASADDAFLETLFCQVHVADFAGVALSEEQVEGLIRMQAVAQRRGYLRDFPAARSLIVEVDMQPVGRLLVDYGSAAIHLVDVALLPEWQGRGIGTTLVKDLQAEARERGIPLQLSVRPQNPALQFYSRLGFQSTGGGLQLDLEWKPNGD